MKCMKYEKLSRDDHEKKLIDKLNDQDPHNIFSSDVASDIDEFLQEEEDEKWCTLFGSCLSEWIFFIFGSFLFVYNHKVKRLDSEDKLEDDWNKRDFGGNCNKLKFMKNWGPTFAFLLSSKTTEGDKNVRSCNFLLTILNAGIFALFSYICLYNLIMVDLDEENEDEKISCKLESVVFPPRGISYELTLLPACVIIPFYISTGFKFAVENGSLRPLKSLFILLEKKCMYPPKEGGSEGGVIATYFRNDIKNKSRLTLLHTMLWFAVIVTVLIMVQEEHLSNIAVLQARLKLDIAEIDDKKVKGSTDDEHEGEGDIVVHPPEMKDAIKESGENNVNSSIEANSTEHSENPIPQPTQVQSKTPTPEQAATDAENSSAFPQRLQDAKDIFERMRLLADKIEMPTKIRLLQLFVIFWSVVAYGFYYSLHFNQNVYPKLQTLLMQLQPDAPSSQPSIFPSASPSISPSASPSVSPPPSVSPSIYLSSGKPSYREKYGKGTPRPPSPTPPLSDSDDDTVPEPPSLQEIVKAFQGLGPKDKHEFFFSVLIFTLMIFTVAYAYHTLMLFADLADAWDNLSKFIDQKAINNHMYGSDFEKLEKFVDSAKDTFKWIFIVKDTKHETSKSAVVKFIAKKIVLALTALIVSQLFVHVPRSFGLQGQESIASNAVKVVATNLGRRV